MPLGTAPSGIRICLRNVCEAHFRPPPKSMLSSSFTAPCCMSGSTWEGIRNQGRIRSFSIQNSLRPVAYAHIQRAGLVQMKVGMPAVPALPQPFGSIGPRFKGRANLLRPHVALSIRGFQRRILTPALFHSITLLQARIQWCFPTIPQSVRAMIWSPRQSCSAVAIRSSLGQGCLILGVDQSAYLLTLAPISTTEPSLVKRYSAAVSLSPVVMTANVQLASG